MADLNTLRRLALALPESSEEPHFGKTSFRVRGKIFATGETGSGIATLKLTPADQDVFGTFDAAAIHPVPNKWGQQGWTRVLTGKVPEPLLQALLTAAWRCVAPARLAASLPEES